MLAEFVEFQEILYTKEYQHLLNKATDRLEIVGGLIRATDIIDLIIEILRGSTSVKQAKGCLMTGDTTDIKFKTAKSQKQASTLDFSERQADAILSMPLSKLIGLELMKLHEESDTLLKNIETYKMILGSTKELHKVIKKQLQEFRKKFAQPRRTEIGQITTFNYHNLAAFWELCKEMPFEKISVNAIAQKANIHRSTFYRYFTDIQHVLEEFEDELLENINADGLSPLSKSLFSSQSFSNKLLANGDESIFTLLMKYSEKIYYLTNVRGDSHFKDKLYNWLRLQAEEIFPAPKNPLAFDYLLTLIFTIILTNANFCYEHRNEADLKEVTTLSHTTVKSCIEQLMLL